MLNISANAITLLYLSLSVIMVHSPFYDLTLMNDEIECVDKNRYHIYLPIVHYHVTYRIAILQHALFKMRFYPGIVSFRTN